MITIATSKNTTQRRAILMLLSATISSEIRRTKHIIRVMTDVYKVSYANHPRFEVKN